MKSIDILFQLQSTIILAIIYYGFAKRKERLKHARIMRFAIIWDLLLVLQIELARGAIKKASQIPTNPFILNFHVLIAVTTVVLYIFMMISGSKLLKNPGTPEMKLRHRKMGILTLVLRTSTYITSYLIKIQF